VTVDEKTHGKRQRRFLPVTIVIDYLAPLQPFSFPFFWKRHAPRAQKK